MRKARVLIIDDETALLTLLNIILEKEGFETVLAENGKIGVGAYEKQHFDLVVTDLMMPERGG